MMKQQPAPRMRMPRPVALLTAMAVAGFGLVVPAAAAPSAVAADPLRSGLVAEYLFDEPSGEVVRNTADGTAVGPDPLDAIVRNHAADQRSEPGVLRLTGGAKTSTGNWVELPDDLLDAGSATISIDVKADPAMLTSNHFLWNIGNDATQQYWFANVRGPRSAITTGSGGGEKNATAYAADGEPLAQHDRGDRRRRRHPDVLHGRAARGRHQDHPHARRHRADPEHDRALAMARHAVQGIGGRVPGL